MKRNTFSEYDCWVARSTAYFESTTSTEPPLRRWMGGLMDMGEERGKGNVGEGQ